MCDTGSILFPKFRSTVHLFFSMPYFLLLFQNCLHPATPQVPVFLHLLLHHQPLVPCFIVPTHLAYAMLGKQRNLFLVTEAFPIIFSSPPLAKHTCLLINLLCIPPPCITTQNNPHIHFSCLKSNGYVLTQHFLNNS